MRALPDRSHPTASRPVWAETSAGALQRNYARLRAAAGPTTQVLAVVKANAYGHGVAGCAPVLAAAGAPWLGVTDVAEGLEVRNALTRLPHAAQPRVLVMCGLWPGDEAACLQANLTPAVWEPRHLDLLQAEAARRNLPANSVAVHLEIDTGMARQGAASGAPLAAFLRHLCDAPQIRVEALFTHFASAECLDQPQNGIQRDLFLAALQQVREAGLHPSLLHAGNTSGVDGGSLQPWLAEAAHAIGATPMTRAGLALYGYALPLSGTPLTATPVAHDDAYVHIAGDAPGADVDAALHLHLRQLEPALTWKTRIASIRDVPAGATVGYNATYVAPRPMRLALLPVGYADGFRRALSSTTNHPGGNVLVGGQCTPLLGRVSMDLSVIDVTALPDARPGDEVVLLGGQGAQQITAATLAAQTGTNTYEVLCGISSRVPRLMVD